ncbi:hypothetical protein B0H16DRAFT_1528699 [Mycena metata]|uniref:Secreted protein n=1 Tax=Mycena metata TaxID=1033252 RepID=A0AAD7NJB2_9AGAR|nr:hypothetical protein B0H16DRAFT_1528699 [Mycena metata]
MFRTFIPILTCIYSTYTMACLGPVNPDSETNITVLSADFRLYGVSRRVPSACSATSATKVNFSTKARKRLQPPLHLSEWLTAYKVPVLAIGAHGRIL